MYRYLMMYWTPPGLRPNWVTNDTKEAQ